MIKHKNKIIINKNKSKPRFGGKQISIKYNCLTPKDSINIITSEFINDSDDDEFVNQILTNKTCTIKEFEENKIFDDYYIVIDFEATCDNKGIIPRNEMEIIEFAAISVRKDILTIEDEFTMFVKPQLHSELTDFCKNLTNITQYDVDTAFCFKDVLESFYIWLNKFEGNKTFCSWGDYDKKQLQQDCILHDVEYPFSDEHINVKKLFSEIKNYNRTYSLGTAIKKLNLEFEGTPHRGIDDARNVAKVLSILLG